MCKLETDSEQFIYHLLRQASVNLITFPNALMYQFIHWKCKPSYELGKTTGHNIKYNKLGTKIIMLS